MKNKKTDKKQVVEADIVEEKKSKKGKKVEKQVEVKKDKKKDKKVKKEKKAKGEGFFKEVIKELKRTKWPDKKYMFKYSIATFGTIIFVCAYFSLVTAIFALIKKGIIG